MLTFETIQKIGNLLGMEYVNFDDKSNIPNDASDGTILTSGVAKIYGGSGKLPPLLVFTGLVPGILYGANNLTKSIYVLNLNTLKPTKNSHVKTILPFELQQIILKELGKNPL